MGFIENYKRLDNLCKQVLNSETGVTTYINRLEAIKDRGFLTEYKKLKTYRHIRNQIVHDNNVSEKNLCTKQDVVWLKQFHDRIINKTDPLELYRRKILGLKTNNNKSNYRNSRNSKKKTKRKALNILKSIVLLILLVCIGLLFYFVMNFMM